MLHKVELWCCLMEMLLIPAKSNNSSEFRRLKDKGRMKEWPYNLPHLPSPKLPVGPWKQGHLPKRKGSFSQAASFRGKVHPPPSNPPSSLESTLRPPPWSPPSTFPPWSPPSTLESTLHPGSKWISNQFNFMNRANVPNLHELPRRQTGWGVFTPTYSC